MRYVANREKPLPAFTVAENLGRKKLSALWTEIKRGATVAECAEAIHLSESRTSRIIHALIEFEPKLKTGAKQYYDQVQGILESEVEEVKREKSEMGCPIYRLNVSVPEDAA